MSGETFWLSQLGRWVLLASGPQWFYSASPHHREPPSPHPALTVCSVAARNSAKAINKTDRFSKDQNTGTPHFIVLCFIAIRNKEEEKKIYIYIFLNKLKVCGNPVSLWYHFSNSHTLVILALFQTFSLLYLFWCSAISDLWRYNFNCFGAPRTAPT